MQRPSSSTIWSSGATLTASGVSLRGCTCMCAYICIRLHACRQYFFFTLCAPSMHAPACLHTVHVEICMCVSVWACVSGAWAVTHSDCEQRPLAGKAVGLAGLSRALEQLCSSARLRWWLTARLHVTPKRHSRELLTGRPPAWTQDKVFMSHCWQPC